MEENKEVDKIFDIITAGSATVDVFIKTHVSRIPSGKRHKELIAYPLGEKILAEDLHQEIGGGATNTAVSFSRMGFRTAYLGVLGQDNNAELIIDSLNKENIFFLGKKKKNAKTNYSVILDSQLDDRTILVYKDASEKLEAKDIDEINSRWFYMSSLKISTMEKAVVLAKEAGACVVFNPSNYTANLGKKKLAKVLKNTDVLIFNKQEAQLLLAKRCDEIHLLRELAKIVEMPVITDGKNGAWVYSKEIIYHAPASKNLKIIETTGAGDAFASGFVSGLMLRLGVEKSLKLGMLNSESVISHLGAKNILLNKENGLRLLKKDSRLIHKIVSK